MEQREGRQQIVVLGLWVLKKRLGLLERELAWVGCGGSVKAANLSGFQKSRMFPAPHGLDSGGLVALEVHMTSGGTWPRYTLNSVMGAYRVLMVLQP